MPIEKSAGAIIFRMEGGKPLYLLLKYNPKYWGFAKGQIEKGESEEETLRREAKEETGISDLKIIPGFRRQEKYFFKRNYGLKKEEKNKVPWTFKLVFLRLAETKTKEIRLSNEHEDFVWLPFEQAIKKATHKNAKEVIKKAHEFITEHITYNMKHET